MRERQRREGERRREQKERREGEERKKRDREMNFFLPLAKAATSALLPGSCPPKSLQGNPRISRPLELYCDGYVMWCDVV